MPDMDELVAHEQARVLGGLKHRYPEDNYSPVELENVNVLLCARALQEPSEPRDAVKTNRLKATQPSQTGDDDNVCPEQRVVSYRYAPHAIRGEQIANLLFCFAMDEGRKRVIGIMAAILASLHMRTADDLFGTPQGSLRTEKLIAASVQWDSSIEQ